MVNYEIIRVDTDILSMQIKYTQEGMPEFYTRVAFPSPYSEESLHEIAKKQALQAQLYWERYLANAPLQLENPSGTTKPTFVESAADYDEAQHKLEESLVEEEDRVVVRFTAVPLTDSEKAAAIRTKRDALLTQTDSFALVDRPMSDEMTAYRAALRGIPEQEGFPNDITWPVMPIE